MRYEFSVRAARQSSSSETLFLRLITNKRIESKQAKVDDKFSEFVSHRYKSKRFARSLFATQVAAART